MSNRPCGYCLIINNYNFEGSSLKNREGTDKDKGILGSLIPTLNVVY